MLRFSKAFVVIIILGFLSPAPAAEPILATATGIVGKGTAEVLIVRPRDAEGRFGKTLSLKIRGTSKITTMVMQTRDKRAIVSQREIEANQAKPNDAVAVIYTSVGDELILLSAIVQTGARK